MSSTPIPSVPERARDTARSHEPLTAAIRSLAWSVDDPDQVLVDTLVDILRSVDDGATLDTLFAALARGDRALHLHVGGDVLAHLRGATDTPLAPRFDQRYGMLMRLATRLDPIAALALHARAEALYRTRGHSLVRYRRIGDTTANALRQLEKLTRTGHETPTVSAVSDASFERRTLPLDSPREDLLERRSARSVRLRLELPAPRPRARRALSSLDDFERAESRWLNHPDEEPVDALSVHVLDEARLSARPSCVVFTGEDGRRRVVGSASDMYHHSAIIGRVGLRPVERRLPLAWLLPRFGPPGNHYHSIADKMAGLTGYRLLGLDCPILAPLPPTPVERHLMRTLLDIDPDRIVVDAGARVLVERGLLVDQKPLRPLFYDLCATTPGRDSPCGPDVYVSRGPGGERVLVNEPEIEAALAARGFDIVRMEEHPLEVQLAIAANARRIVGPHGAGLANAVFAARGCALLELVPATYMNSCFARLALDCGHRYGVLIGDAVDAGSDPGVPRTLGYRVDVDAVLRVLDDAAERTSR